MRFLIIFLTRARACGSGLSWLSGCRVQASLAVIKTLCAWAVWRCRASV